MERPDLLLAGHLPGTEPLVLSVPLSFGVSLLAFGSGPNQDCSRDFLMTAAFAKLLIQYLR